MAKTDGGQLIARSCKVRAMVEGGLFQDRWG